MFRPDAVSAELVLADSETTFDCELRALTVTPNSEWLNTLCPPGSWPDVTWTLDLTYLPGTTSLVDGAGDTVAAETLDQYLFDHYGEHVDFIAWPYGPTIPGYTGIVSLAPGGIGGTQGEWPEQSVSLPIDGQPEQVQPSDLEPGGSLPQIRQHRQRVLARSRRRWW